MQCRNADKRRLGDVAVLDLDSFTWKRPAVSGTSPSPREGAAAAYHAGHMVLFGMCYSTRPAGFSSVVVAVAQMSRASRHQQASTLAGSNVNLLPPCTVLLASCLPPAGGHASGGRTNDLLLLELSGWTWSQPTTTGTAPSPRSGAALCIGHGRYLVIHGGRNNFVLDSAHVLDLMTRTWVEVRLLHTTAPAGSLSASSNEASAATVLLCSGG
jgi:hypothetical protein